MQIINPPMSDGTTVEIIADQYIINNIDDGADLLGNLYYQGYAQVIIHEENINPQFFDLKTKIAGEILQKFVNYKVRLCIIGDFAKYNSKSLNDFIYESNKGKAVNFLSHTDQAIEKFKH
ncbi:DUF4180 domain-containing protein [Pedobacter montanisoli]|uniref:DUF4180 domain-containing protein n=1 Tax=Pedobacter montanisoli TaxID=2923277 RepID=A0ABS9ZWU1_9SPHI|nr:DUF4180 domain-containing protein [Pedobacter montanisoli]MCJ0742762.1 DUF4180 domain-containing protein [Pedobacter montanisoli]